MSWEGESFKTVEKNTVEQTDEDARNENRMRERMPQKS